MIMSFRLNVKRQKSRLASDLKTAATPSSIFKHYGLNEDVTKLMVYKMAYIQLMSADDLQHRLKALIDGNKLSHNASMYVKKAYERITLFNRAIFNERDFNEKDKKSLKLLDWCEELQEDREFDKRVNEFIYQIELLNAKAITDTETRRLYAQLVGCQAIVQQSMKVNNRYYIENDIAMENLSNCISCALNYLVPTKKGFSDVEQQHFDQT